MPQRRSPRSRFERRALDSRPSQVGLGRNDLGASSCQRLCSGEILRRGRLAW